MNKQGCYSIEREYSGKFQSSEYIKELLSKLEIYYDATDTKYGKIQKMIKIYDHSLPSHLAAAFLKQ